MCVCVCASVCLSGCPPLIPARLSCENAVLQTRTHTHTSSRTHLPARIFPPTSGDQQARRGVLAWGPQLQTATARRVRVVDYHVFLCISCSSGSEGREGNKVIKVTDKTGRQAGRQTETMTKNAHANTGCCVCLSLDQREAMLETVCREIDRQNWEQLVEYDQLKQQQRLGSLSSSFLLFKLLLLLLLFKLLF